MSAFIDWLTIVGHRQVDEIDWSVGAAYVTAAEDLQDRCSLFGAMVGNPKDWDIVKPRAPYSYARRSADCSRTLYVHPLSAHYTLEISGTHCARMLVGPLKEQTDFLTQFAENFSRIDIAVDMHTDVTPIEFCRLVDAPQIKTRSEMVSSTGQTCYLGSRASERFCRVYRYFAPHPRAELLRAEWQLKGDYAKETACAIGAGVPLDDIAQGLAQTFGFKHPVWPPVDDAYKVRVASHAQSGSTVHWLTTTIAPLMKRLNREGKLNLAEWLREYVVE